MTARRCVACGEDYVQRRKNQVTCSTKCAKQRSARLCDLASHCSGICRKYAVKRHLKQGYVRGLYDLIGLERPKTIPDSVRVMHVIDSSYWNCRKCGINIHYAGTRCPCCKYRLRVSGFSGCGTSLSVAALERAIRKARAAGTVIPPVPLDAHYNRHSCDNHHAPQPRAEPGGLAA